jgi:hypothetical protein
VAEISILSALITCSYNAIAYCWLVFGPRGDYSAVVEWTVIDEKNDLIGYHTMKRPSHPPQRRFFLCFKEYVLTR